MTKLITIDIIIKLLNEFSNKPLPYISFKWFLDTDYDHKLEYSNEYKDKYWPSSWGYSKNLSISNYSTCKKNNDDYIMFLFSPNFFRYINYTDWYRYEYSIIDIYKWTYIEKTWELEDKDLQYIERFINCINEAK